jgi:putative Ca2+/H+ antiporter (TMEM165/GDT1 family)
LANHALAGLAGVWFGKLLSSAMLDAAVGVSMLGMALWTLKPDPLGDGIAINRRGAFLATLIAFFIAEIGDKTPSVLTHGPVMSPGGYSPMGRRLLHSILAEGKL